MIKEGVKFKILEDDYIEVEIKEFGHVDDNFVNFVLDELCDYDDLKHTNIYKGWQEHPLLQ